MKIAVVSPMIYPCPAIKGGAVERLTQYLAEEIAKHKNEVDLYTIYDENLKKINKIDNLNIIQIKVSPITRKINLLYEKINNKIFRGKLKYFNLIYKKTAKLVAKTNDYDYIVVENEMLLYNYVYRYNKKTRIVYHMHNDFYAMNRTPKCYETISKTAFKILTVSEYIKNRCLKIKETNNIVTLYNCIDTEIFDGNKEKNYRKKYKIKEDDIVIGFAGRLLKEKGILELVKAFKRVKTNENIKLLIVGTRDYGKLKKDKYLENIYSEIKDIEDKVIFTGHLDNTEMPLVYNTMNLLVIPSIWEEPFGCVAIEAMSMGLPIIATKSGGLVEIINTSNGFLIKKDKEIINELVEKLEVFINSKKTRESISKLTQEDFNKHKEYTKENYYSNFIKSLEM